MPDPKPKPVAVGVHVVVWAVASGDAAAVVFVPVLTLSARLPDPNPKPLSKEGRAGVRTAVGGVPHALAVSRANRNPICATLVTIASGGEEEGGYEAHSAAKKYPTHT